MTPSMRPMFADMYLATKGEPSVPFTNTLSPTSIAVAGTDVSLHTSTTLVKLTST